jgi:hypothetical protein
MINAILITEELLEKLNRNPAYLEIKNMFIALSDAREIFQDIISAQLAHIIFLIQIFGNEHEKKNFHNIANRFLDKKNSTETIFGIILMPQCLTIETKNKIFDFIIVKIIGLITLRIGMKPNVHSGKYFSMFQNELLKNSDIKYIYDNNHNEYIDSLKIIPFVIYKIIKLYGTNDEKNILPVFVQEKNGIYDFLYHSKYIKQVIDYYIIKIINPLIHKLYLGRVEDSLKLFSDVFSNYLPNTSENNLPNITLRRKKQMLIIFCEIEFTSYFSIHI